jgi:hypothetical protein
MVTPTLHEQSTPKPVCFGFEIRSPFSFHFARPGVATDVLEVVPFEGEPPVPKEPPLYQWEITTPTGEVESALYGRDGVFEFWNSEVGWYRIVPSENTIEMPSGAGVDPARVEQLLWNLPAIVCAVERGDVALHASAVDIGDGAVIMAGPGYHGKTTLALAFHEAGYRVLTEDVACCRLDPSPVVFPGPAMVRVRTEGSSLRVPKGMRVAARQPGRVQLAIDEERRGDAAPVPIRAVVFLRSSSDGIRLERVPVRDAIIDLWALAFHLPNGAGRAHCFSQVADLAGTVRIVNLYRPFDVARLAETVASVVAECVR